jgi:hypothetical protein
MFLALKKRVMPAMISKGVYVYLKDEKLFIQTKAMLDTGLVAGYEPIYILSKNVDINLIGQTYLQAIHGFIFDAPSPKKLSDLQKPLIKMAKQKSWIGFINRSKLVLTWLDEKNQEFCYMPTKNQLTRGHRGLVDLEFSIPITSTDEEIGQAVLRALELCE